MAINENDLVSIVEVENLLSAAPNLTMHIDSVVNLVRRQALLIEELEQTCRHYEDLLDEYEDMEDDHK